MSTTRTTLCVLGVLFVAGLIGGLLITALRRQHKIEAEHQFRFEEPALFAFRELKLTMAEVEAALEHGGELNGVRAIRRLDDDGHPIIRVWVSREGQGSASFNLKDTKP